MNHLIIFPPPAKAGGEFFWEKLTRIDFPLLQVYIESANLTMRTVMVASAKDLKADPQKLLEAVLRGEEVIITYRGKPRAKLVPLQEHVDDEIDSPGSAPLFGIWKDHELFEDVEDYLRNLRKG